MVSEMHVAAARREMEEAALQIERLAVELSRIPHRGYEVHVTVSDAVARFRALVDQIERANIILAPIHASAQEDQA